MAKGFAKVDNGFGHEKWIRGGVQGPLLMKQKKKRKHLLRNLHRRRKNFFLIYDVIVKQKIKKRSVYHYE